MILRREPDFEQFLKVLWRRGRPDHLPFYEHLASPGFIARRTETEFDRMAADDEDYWRIYVDFWLGMGFDCIPMEISPKLPLPEVSGGLTRSSDAHAVVQTMSEFEEYPWPDEAHYIDLRHFEAVAGLLPDGAKIVGGVASGPHEWVRAMMGTVGLSYALADTPELVGLMFQRTADLHMSAFRRLAAMDAIGALRQGDDLGFKTSTLMSPDDLRRYVFPIYTRMAAVAHEAGKPFIFHSCGALGQVYDDLIHDCGIDAKHSFEDDILPVAEFKSLYGQAVAPLGGLDVDVICRSTPDEIRAYVRKTIEQCFYDGYWALGTGSSLTDYMPVENYIAALEEGIRMTS